MGLMVWQADRVARRASCFFLLAALLWCLPALAIRPDSLENRVGGCGHPASGQASAAASQTVENAMGCGGCGYENASGQGRWLNRDPIGEPGFEAVRRINPWGGIRSGGLPAELSQGPNLYTFVRNNPANFVDPLGLQIPPAAMDELAQLSEELQPEEEALEAEAEKAWEAFAQKFSDLVQKARETYPKLCGKFQWHHPIPKYLGGDPDQPLVLLEAPYHQLITTAFRQGYAYGQDIPPANTVVNLVTTVYSQYPLPK